MIKVSLSAWIAVFLLAAIAFHAQPTLAAFINILVFIIPLIFLVRYTSRFEGYKLAKNEFAPGKPTTGHPLYKVTEWLESSHFGIQGIWYAIGLVAMLLVYRWWFH